MIHVKLGGFNNLIMVELEPLNRHERRELAKTGSIRRRSK